MKSFSITLIGIVIISSIGVFSFDNTFTPHAGDVSNEKETGSYTLEFGLDIQKRRIDATVVNSVPDVNAQSISDRVKDLTEQDTDVKISDNEFIESTQFLVDEVTIYVEPKIIQV